MSELHVHVEPSFIYRSFHSDESGEWECRYCPEAPENEQITLRDDSFPGAFEMSVETARAVAHILLAAVQKHDTDKSFQELIAKTKEN